ncbi:MAG: hypothetical protein ACJAWQ_002464, partial [Paraglaciecola sp.]
MIKLNKIVNLMVMAGVVHYSSVAFAADIQVSQDFQFANQTSVSQQTDTGQAKTNPVTGPDSSAQSNNDAQGNTNAQANTDSSAEQQQIASATDESYEEASTQLGELNTDLASNSLLSLSSTATQSTSVITANNLSTVSQLQLPSTFNAESAESAESLEPSEPSESMNDFQVVQQTTPIVMLDVPELSNAVAFDNTANIGNSLSANVEQLASLELASQAFQIINQSANTAVANSIT